METGKQKEPIVIEPIEDPVPTKEPVPTEPREPVPA